MKNATLKLRVVILFALAIPAFAKANDAASPFAAFDLKLPLGISQDVWSYFVPKDNPLTAAKVELGRKLFSDQRLSADGSVSCATCHEPKRAFTDGRRVAEGIAGRRGTRNSPTLLNAMFNTGQFWDGRVESLEAQAKLPLVNPDEMGAQTHQQVVARIQALPEYVRAFEQAFGTPVTLDGLAKALASFERTLVSANSPLDRYVAGDLNALNEAQRQGFMLFRGKARCAVCHTFSTSFPFLTDGNYRNTGVAANFAGFSGLAKSAMQVASNYSPEAIAGLARQGGSFELGRFLMTGNSLDIGAYRTPSLRNVELTAPYFHDGSAATLTEVVKFYVKGGQDNAFRDWQLEAVALNDEEQHNLVEFLKSLTSDDARRIINDERGTMSDER